MSRKLGLLVGLLMTVGGAGAARAVNIAYFNDVAFVDTSREGAILSGALADSLGHTVTQFTGTTAAAWTTALRTADVLVIPELESGNLFVALPLDTRSVLIGYVLSGGGLIVNDSVFNTGPLLNGLFGYALAEGFPLRGGGGSPSNLNAAAAAGTAFAGGPPTLPASNAVDAYLTSSLPPGALSLYESGTATTVFAADMGSGRIVSLGHDWFEIPSPVEWVAVLGSAVTYVDTSVPQGKVVAVYEEPEFYGGPGEIVNLKDDMAAFGSSWLEQKQKRLAQEEKKESERQRTLQRELEWIRLSPKARRSKSKARITAYENLLNQQSEKAAGDFEIYIPPGPRLGKLVIEADNLSKAYEGRLLMDKICFSLPPGGIVGIIGPNGAGKTTLFRMITGQEQPDSGTIRIGETVKLAYVDQSRDSLDPKQTIFQVISEGQETIWLGTREINARAYVAKFNFTGSDQQNRVGEISGGQRNRVHLARMLKEGGNVLLLDEPTNDLDINTMRALEEALENFAGCAVVISHDRWFLDRIATHIMAFEGNSEVVWFEGNYSDYERDYKNRKGADADQPHRIRYRQLTRE